MKEMDSYDYKTTHITISNCTTELLNFNFQKRTVIYMYVAAFVCSNNSLLKQNCQYISWTFFTFFETFFNYTCKNAFPFYKHTIFINVAIKIPIQKPTITSATVWPSTTRSLFNLVPSFLFLSSTILFNNFPCSPTE